MRHCNKAPINQKRGQRKPVIYKKPPLEICILLHRPWPSTLYAGRQDYWSALGPSPGWLECPKEGQVTQVHSTAEFQKLRHKAFKKDALLLYTSSDGLQPSSDGLHLVAFCY